MDSIVKTKLYEFFISNNHFLSIFIALNRTAMDKEIQLLNNLIARLDEKDFNLEAWKSFTIVILARIFGDNSQKIKQIENIEYDYSSWSLRDTSGMSHMDQCKKLARQIIEASILEIEMLGLPGKDTSKEAKFNMDIIVNAIKNELSSSEFNELKKLIDSGETLEVLRKKIADKLIVFGSNISPKIVANILTNKEITEEFKNL